MRDNWVADSEAKLLPVRVTVEGTTALPGPLCEPRALEISSSGTIHIQLRQAQVRVEGSADLAVLRVLLECLQR